VNEDAEALRGLLRRANHQYYCLDAPEISDYEYDMLMLALQRLEKQDPENVPPDSPTQTVGCQHKKEPQ